MYSYGVNFDFHNDQNRQLQRTGTLDATDTIYNFPRIVKLNYSIHW